jgi:Na+/H+ antiporter NhaC
MSSLSSGCPHLEHIRTQIPYALTVMVAAGACGYVGRSFGLPTWSCYLIAVVLLGATLLLLGRNPDRL